MTPETVLALVLVAGLLAVVAIIAYRTGYERAADEWGRLWAADARRWQAELDRVRRGES